jgi:hypothetical protein
VVDDAGGGEVVGNIPLGLGEMLQVYADQRHKAGGLHEEKQDCEPKADMPPDHPQRHVVNGLSPPGTDTRGTPNVQQASHFAIG